MDESKALTTGDLLRVVQRVVDEKGSDILVRFLNQGPMGTVEFQAIAVDLLGVLDDDGEETGEQRLVMSLDVLNVAFDGLDITEPMGEA